MTEKYLYVHTVAKRLSCSTQHVYTLIKNGEIKAIRLGIRALRVTESSLNDFIKSNELDPEDYFI